jgi:hypothetical protein
MSTADTHTIGTRRRALKAGDRVILRYDDSTEELRTVAIGPKLLPGHNGPAWWIWLDGNMGRFKLWRVRPV